MTKRPTFEEIAREAEDYLASVHGERRHNGHRAKEGQLFGMMLHTLSGVGPQDGVDTIAADVIANLLHMVENAGGDIERAMRLGRMNFEAERDDPEEAEDYDPDTDEENDAGFGI